ncbi:hypothetical protein OESDEN_03988 [Oesophagostomum dentatum]|uniref:Uncharacterized protein n=1 Tax=Oesophagostomum dentatum TaxID=61180 RepID=A0A0B1TKX4_OESDE|nr:hypothetical protein OESDEN_03988 [Oesophagostomum dentatum]
MIGRFGFFDYCDLFYFTILANAAAKEKTNSSSTATTLSGPVPTSGAAASPLLGSTSMYGTAPAAVKASVGPVGSGATGSVKSDGQVTSVPVVPSPIGPPASAVDKELPRKAPGYRSPSAQASSAGGSSIFAEQAISSVPSSVSSTPPPSVTSVGADATTRCSMGSPPAPIAPPPGFTTLVSEVGKSVSAKGVANPLSSVEAPAIDTVTSPLNSASTLPLGKLSSADPLTTPTGASNDLSSMQFLDENTRAKLAEIWGTGKQEQSSQEQAWGNQVLLNNFSNLGIGSSSSDWTSAPSDSLFITSPSSKIAASMPSSQLPASTYQSSTAFPSTTSTSDWNMSANKCLPLYARPQVCLFLHMI